MDIPIGTILVVLILLILLFWVLRQLPLPEPIGRIILVVATVLVVLWLISLIGIGGLTIQVPG